MRWCASLALWSRTERWPRRSCKTLGWRSCGVWTGSRVGRPSRRGCIGSSSIAPDPPGSLNIITLRSATTSAVRTPLDSMKVVGGHCRPNSGATIWTIDFMRESCRRRSGPRSMNFLSSNEALWHSVTSRACAAGKSVTCWTSPRQISGFYCIEVEAECAKPSRLSSVRSDAHVSSSPRPRVPGSSRAGNGVPRRCTVCP